MLHEVPMWAVWAKTWPKIELVKLGGKVMPTHPGVLEICCASHARYIRQDLRWSELLARARAQWKEWVVWLCNWDLHVATPLEYQARMPPYAEPSNWVSCILLGMWSVNMACTYDMDNVEILKWDTIWALGRSLADLCRVFSLSFPFFKVFPLFSWLLSISIL